KLLKMATTDSMTGINNRQHFTELGSREFAIFERHGHPVSVLMFDLDFFKSINDTYGHNTGDEAIIHFADICIQNLRAEDILGRIGGEEFAAVLPATDIDAAFKVADRIREKTESTAITHPDGNILLTVSIGVTTVETKPASLAIALQQADKALYEAKNSGRNKVVLYSADKTQ
ncbi:MAG TPA: diguanylate cyclase response regulator, partial [Spirochaeta sp.]|nr:diguanylate cyclase response regulator [Spirochaeta sp.]